MKNEISILFFLIVILSSCKNNLDNEVKPKIEDSNFKNWKEHWEETNHKKILFSNSSIHTRIKECLKDTSIIVITSTLINDIERYSKIKSLGDINNDGLNDSIIIIPELYITDKNGIEEGASAIFTDIRIPRIRVDSPCLEVDYFFPVDDINKDGIIELGKYYSSCASRFKGLQLISLENKEWNIKGQVTFDIFYEEPKKEERIQKLGLNRFRMREITSESNDSIIDTWTIFEIK